MSDADFLRREAECFREERERVRQVIGRVGGSRSGTRERIVNVAFLLLVGLLFTLSLLREVFGIDMSHLSSTLSMEIAVLLVSLKITCMMQRQTRVDHFQFWVLNSIEFRISAIDRRLGDLEKSTASSSVRARQSRPL